MLAHAPVGELCTKVEISHPIAGGRLGYCGMGWCRCKGMICFINVIDNPCDARFCQFLMVLAWLKITHFDVGVTCDLCVTIWPTGPLNSSRKALLTIIPDSWSLGIAMYKNGCRSATIPQNHKKASRVIVLTMTAALVAKKRELSCIDLMH